MLRFTNILIISLLFAATVTAQRFNDVEIKAEKVSENLFMLTGAGGNIVILTGEDGVFMIDDQFAELSEKIKTAIAELTDQPIRYLINTHWHGDHTGGNENFDKEGAIIVAHENVRKRMSTEQLMKAFSRTVPPSPKGALPVITFSENVNFYLNGEDILIFHVHNAHTDGDAIVYFPKSNSIHLGDTYFAGRYPFIDISSGGSVRGIIESATTVLSLIDDETKIIPGHGKISTKKELAAYRDMLQDISAKMSKAIADGKTYEEIKTLNISEDYDDEWGTGFISGEKLIEILYSDLSRPIKEEVKEE